MGKKGIKKELNVSHNLFFVYMGISIESSKTGFLAHVTQGS